MAAREKGAERVHLKQRGPGQEDDLSRRSRLKRCVSFLGLCVRGLAGNTRIDMRNRVEVDPGKIPSDHQQGGGGC